MSRRVNISDVAKEAGVSTATISYVLNHKATESISAETEERVYAAIKKLDYVPNLSARSLVSKRSNMIGVVIPQTEPGKEFMFSNPYYGEFLSNVEYTARKNGYHVLISGTEANQSYINVAKNRGLDGIVIVGMYPDEFYMELKQSQVPIVMVDSYCNEHYFHNIGINDRHGGYLATQHLINNGHQRIAFVSGKIREEGVNYKRFLGYQDAMKEAGLEINQSSIYTGNVSHEYGIEAAKLMIENHQNETAAFVTADIMAVGLIKGLKQQGQRVPEDVSVVGFDDVYLANISDPSLTTIRQNIAEKGNLAAEVIIEAATNKNMTKRDIILPIEVVERLSVRKL